MPAMTFLCRWHEIRLTLHQAEAYPAGGGLGDLGCSTSTLVGRRGMAVGPGTLLLPRLPAFHSNGCVLRRARKCCSFRNPAQPSTLTSICRRTGQAFSCAAASTSVPTTCRVYGPAIARETIFQWFGARQLRPAELPELFNILAEVCGRARLSRLPDIYCLPAPDDMNAYALGDPQGAAIILTEGLLRRMTRDEIAGILAHEVAHIRNNDIWTMSWAAALHRAIEWTSLMGLALLRAQHSGAPHNRPLAALLRAAPSIAELLRLALSRTRELDADATAIELTGDSQALIAALDKLERHHAGFSARPVAATENGPMRLLRSHPATSERVGALLGLAY